MKDCTVVLAKEFSETRDGPWARDVNTFDIWLSIRIERDTDEIRLDRVCLKRAW